MVHEIVCYGYKRKENAPFIERKSLSIGQGDSGE
jgi:hypothetical protein